MKRVATYLRAALVVSLLVVPVLARAERPSVTSSERVQRTVRLRDVIVRDGSVSGVIVNNSPRLLRDVRLLVRHSWHWENERHPGDDNPSRAEPFVAPGEVPPGGMLPFDFALDPPLPRRSDGHFVTSAEVVGFTEVGE